MNSPLSPEAHRFRRALECLIGSPATEGNRIDVLRNGDEIFPAMLDAIRDARSTVDLLTFIYWTGDIAQKMANALTDAAGRDVRVRVLLDTVGARLMDRDLVREMRKAGCQVEWFRPPTTWKVWEQQHRTHRKILVCDERVAFTGGVGIAEEWEGDARSPDEWRDTHVRIVGPAVDGLRAAFIENWVETGRPLFDEQDEFPDQEPAGASTVQIVRGDPGVGHTDIKTLYTTLLRMAQKSVRISTAYFSPDDELRDRLCDAVRRGVTVEVLVPGPHADKRVVQLAGEDEFQVLLDSGVHICSYQPTMLHTKIVLVDGVVACVGSANFNSRAIGRDDEVMVVTYDPDVVDVLDTHFDEDAAQAELLDPARWRERSVVQKAMESATNIIEDHI